MTDNHAYIVRGDDGVEYGPVTLAELREWVAENRAGLGTDVRLEGTSDEWHPWQFYPELVALVAEVGVRGQSSQAPVLGSIGRRSAAFVMDLIMSFTLVIFLWVTIYGFLPVEVVESMIRYSQAILEQATPPAPPTPPQWFVLWSNVIFLVVPILYYAGFHAAHGRTPGKSIFHLRITDGQGNKPSLGKALLRSLVLVISVYFLYGIPLLYAFFNPQRRALHDLAAGTFVVES